MNTTTPFIGSKISLISKAEIRYEGILYQVDTENSTVTLAKVRSFGTEGRPSPKQIQPRSEVYEFIIFRGSDIKDLNVSEMPEQHTGSLSPPQDPAILSAQSAISSSAPSSTTGPAQPPPTQTRPPHIHGPLPPHPYFQPHPSHGYSAYGVPYFRPPLMMSTGGALHYPRPILPPAGGQPRLPPPPVHTTSASQGLPTSLVTQQGSFMGAQPAEVITPPRSLVDTTAPSSTLVATPTAIPESVVKPQASSTPLAEATSSTQPLPEPVMTAPAEPVQVLDQEHPIRPTSTTAQSHQQSPQPSRQSPSPPPSQVKRNGERGGRGGGRRGRKAQPQEENTRRQPARSRDNPQSEHANHYGNSNWTSQGYQRGRREGNNYRRGGRGRGAGGRGGGGWRGEKGTYLRQNSDHRSAGPSNNRNAFKYESEFDFESANARFKKEDFELEFKQKLKIDDDTKKLSEGSGHDLEGVSSDDEVVIVEEEEVPEEEEEFYDKSKSFFDNISCEGAPGTNRRPSRNEEREVNTETFGVNSVDKNYGYYRHRHNWHGRGRGGDFRGRGRYRGGGNRGDYGGGHSNHQNRHHDYAQKAETNTA